MFTVSCYFIILGSDNLDAVIVHPLPSSWYKVPMRGDCLRAAAQRSLSIPVTLQSCVAARSVLGLSGA